MDVGGWLRTLGLGQYEAQFRENHIDSDVLPNLTAEDLKELGVDTVGHRRKLLTAIVELSNAPAAPASETKPLVLAQPHAERRHLTVMFCDLVGSTELAARLDPEDLREIVRAYQKCCADIIGGYEGFVAQYLGDGVMAYFGYPQAHEDDAERAVRAGLDLVTAVAKLGTKAKIEVRVGIATGLVVVGDLIGEGAAKERAVTGETPNLAARLQGLAAPNSIVVAATTARLLGALFDVRNLGSQQLKGLAEPVQAWAVAGVRSFESRFEARAGWLTSFVGREEEGELLLKCKRFAWQGKGQVVLVSGEAGIGKSRLTAWLGEKITSEPHIRLHYQCTPHHRDSPLHPFIVHLERAMNTEPNASPRQKLEKLEAVLALAGHDAVAAVPLFAALLAIPTTDRYPPLDLSPGQQLQRTMASMLSQLEGLARQRPVLLLYEDAHWADATSLELVDMMIQRIARLPVLMVVTGRPEFSPAWVGRRNVLSLELTRLAKRDARAMVEAAAGGAALPSEVLDQIVAKTDGIPLFVEELTRNVLESGLLIPEGRSYRLAGPFPALAIPATLQDSLMARLDRLNPVKEIAQIGAAIGREFSYELLVSVGGTDETTVRSALAKLEESGLASRRGVPPAATYTFKHALVQDTAYESLLKSRRQTIHRRIARALRDNFPVLAETEPETIAHHFDRAGRTDQAVEWWAKAGELAQRRSAYVEAIGHFEKAIHLVDSLPDAPARRPFRLRLQLAYGRTLIAVNGYGARESRASFARAAELAAQIGNFEDRVSATWYEWIGAFSAGEMFRAWELAQTFALEAGTQPDRREALVERMLGATCFGLGRFGTAKSHYESAIAALDSERDGPLVVQFGHDFAVSGWVFLARVLFAHGDIRRARGIAEEAELRAVRINHLNTLAWLYGNKGIFEVMRGDPNRIIHHGRRLFEIASEHGLRWYLASAHMLHGWGLWLNGKEESGREEFGRGYYVISELKYAPYKPLYAMLWSNIEASREPDAALAILDSTLVETMESGQRWLDAELHRHRGIILRQRLSSDFEGAEAAFRQSHAIACVQQAHTFELRAALDLARLFRDTGRERDAGTLLATALDGFVEAPELPEFAEATLLLTSLGEGGPPRRSSPEDPTTG